MNDKSIEELIIRWMDGETISPEEEARLKEVYASTPDKIIPPKEYAPIKESLKSALSSDKDIPNAESFQSSLLERIEKEGGREIIKPSASVEADKITPISKAQEEKSESANVEPSNVEPISKYPTYQKKRHNWFLTVAGMAACFLIGLLINLNTNKNQSQIAGGDQVISQDHLQPVFYSPNDNITADYPRGGDTNIIIINGLDDIPDDVDLFSLFETTERTPIKVYPNTTHPEYEN